MFRKLRKWYFKIYHLFKLLGIFILVFGIKRNIYAEELPKDYYEVPYIESNKKEYIDTGVKANSEINIKIIAQCSNWPTEGCGGLYGGGVNWQNKYIQGEIDSSPFFAFNNNTYNRYYNGNGNTFYTVRQNKNIITINDNTFYTFNYIKFSTDYNIVLFAVNRSNNIIENGKYKIKEVSIENNGVLVRNYKPVYQYSSKEYGLYDMVEGKFYKNLGEGKFETDKNIVIPENPSKEDIFSTFLTIYTDRLEYLANGFTENPYLLTMIGIIFSFIVLELFLKILNLRGGKNK